MLLDDTLQVLSNERRRKIMYVLEDEGDDVLSYEEVTEGLVKRDYMREEERDRFKAQMTHSHLPQLEESGLLENDKRSETVRYIQDEDVEDLLEFVKEYEE